MLMKALVVFDSVFGNTEQIARSIAQGLNSTCEVQCLNAGEVSIAQLNAADIVVMGSPTRSFNATPATISLLESIPIGALQDKKVATFDTRISMTGVKGLLFKKMIDKGGYAAPLIASQLESRGGILALTAEGFFVKAETGPLVKGEEERAARWAQGLLSGDLRRT
jgi:flavodoxin